MSEIYFKREQFYKDKRSEQEVRPDQPAEGLLKVQERKGKDDKLFFSRDRFYKKPAQPSEAVEPSSPTTPPVQSQKPTQIKDGQVFKGSNFSLTLPKDWLKTTTYMLLGPQEQGEQLSIQILVEENIKAKSAAEYAKQQMAVIEEHLPKCQILHQGEVSLANGDKAYEVILSWSFEDNSQLYQRQVFVVSGGIGYNLTAIFTEKAYKTRCQEITSIFMGFNPG